MVGFGLYLHNDFSSRHEKLAAIEVKQDNATKNTDKNCKRGSVEIIRRRTRDTS